LAQKCGDGWGGVVALTFLASSNVAAVQEGIGAEVVLVREGVVAPTVEAPSSIAAIQSVVGIEA
jgi:hypothetical protein